MAANNGDDQDGFSTLDLDKKDLDDMTKVSRKLERENRSLFDEIRHLRDRQSDEKADQSDVYYYLHKRLDDNYEVISALERQLVVEATDREKDEMEYEKQIEELQQRRVGELAPLKDKLTALEGLVKSMDEVAKNKRESDARRARLEKEVESTRSIIESDLSIEQRKKLQEKQRVKREIEKHIEQLSIELSSKKEAELAEKTLQAAEKNQKLHTLLHSKAKQAERMMIINQGLAFENSRIRNDIDLANISEAALGERVRVYEDLVSGLKAKLEQMGYFDNDMDDRELADLEESPSGQSITSTTMSGTMRESLSELRTMSLASDTSPGVQDDSLDGFFGGLAYESADELRVATKSLKHLHQELQGEAQHLTVCTDKENAARDASKGDDDPLVVVLLDATQKWVSLSKSNVEDREGEIEEENKASLVSRMDSDNSGKGLGRQRRNVGGSGRIVHDRVSNRNSPETPKAEMEQTIRRGLTHERVGSTAWPVDSGPLAKLIASPLLCRELFYNLVEAFRDYQTKSRPANEATVENSDTKNCPDGTLVKTSVTDGTSVRGIGESLTHVSRDTQNDAAFHTHVREECSRASMSDLSSVSVCTLGELGSLERRNASTQTVLKVDVNSVHFPEKFAAVRATRRCVIKNTFLTTNSMFSASTGRSGGFGTLSNDSQLNRR